VAAVLATTRVLVLRVVIEIVNLMSWGWGKFGMAFSVFGFEVSNDNDGRKKISASGRGRRVGDVSVLQEVKRLILSIYMTFRGAGEKAE
jgi:hypothetical protein